MSEFIGTMQPREDITILPKSKTDIVKEHDIYQWYALTDKIPSIKASRDLQCQQWELERQAFLIEDQRLREAAWARGEMTLLMEPIFPKPYPRPYNPNFEGWKILKFTTINLIKGDKNED